MDEPTAVLTPQEIDELMGILRNFIKEGKSVILITHKLKEIMMIADRVTVLRRGKMVGTVDIDQTNEDSLAELMVGREVSFEVQKEPAKPKQDVLVVEDLWLKDARGVDVLQCLSLHVRAGEILGIAGVDGNGQRELVEVITRLRKQDKGSVMIDGKDISRYQAHDRHKAKFGHIPEDRQRRGLVLDFTLAENLILEKYNQAPFAKNGVLQPEAIERNAEQLIETFDVRSGEGKASLARTMSGGNQQKAIIAREFDLEPSLMIASQPTRGLDVGAIEYIHKRLIELRDAGAAVLLVSFELDEILNLADRINVIYSGKIVADLDPKETDERELGLYMSGSKEATA